MKKFLVEISDDAHTELIKIQSERKIKKMGRATLQNVASDTLERCLLNNKKETPTK
jgi:hypothetical protein